MSQLVNSVHDVFSLNIYCFAFVASAYRWNEKEVTLPRIPGHPIGYADAEQLLRYQ